MFTWLKELFRKKNNHLIFQDDSIDNKLSEGMNALQQGFLKLTSGNNKDALALFDIAVSYGISEAYEQRAFCLQKLEYHLDALDDFEQAIILEPDNCNLYFSRCVSYLAVGKKQEAINSINKAVELSKIESSTNKSIDAIARSQCHGNLIDMMTLHQKGINVMAGLRLPIDPRNLIRRA